MNQPHIASEKSAAVNLSTTGVKATFSFSTPAKILLAGILVRNNDTNGCTVKLSKAAAGASITASGNVATIIIPAANTMGKLVYANLNDSTVEVDAGQEVQAEVTATNLVASSAVVVLEWTRLDERPANLTNLQATS